MKSVLIAFSLALPVALSAQNPVTLPEITVYSPRIANQAPAGTFAMPVSALRFEPQVDLESRNLAEGQADVTIRGGIFENSAFQIGAVAVTDPQTGHYFAEIPIAPAMLSAPEIFTGADLSLKAVNTTVGVVGYGWRPIQTAGYAAVGLGQHEFERGEFYQGFVTKPVAGGAKYGADVAWAHSKSDGPIAYGEHDFSRADLRLQRRDDTSQCDVFAGYQAKKFGWPNMYTPFNSDETENLETVLLAANHRVDLGGGQFVEAGVYHRRNKDDYAFNRFAPLGPVHPFQHTTWVTGAAVTARHDLGPVALNLRGEILGDKLQSTSLTFGRYHTRTMGKVAVVPEESWTTADGARITARAGVAYERSNHDSGSVDPVVSVSRELPSAALRRIYASYTKTSQVPTYTALNSSAAGGLFRGNPRLGREKSHNFEVGATSVFEGWTANAAVFWRRDDSLVDWTFRRGVTARTANAVDIDVTGVEAVVRRSWSAVDLTLGYTGLSKDADYRGAVVDASFYALNYARHRLTAAFTARLGGGLELRVDNVARIQADNLLRVIGGNHAVITSVSLAYRPPTWREFEVSVAIDNVWDSVFQEIPAVPAAGRLFSAGASYRW